MNIVEELHIKMDEIKTMLTKIEAKVDSLIPQPTTRITTKKETKK